MIDLATVVANLSQDPVQGMTAKKVKLFHYKLEMFHYKLHIPDVAS